MTRFCFDTSAFVDSWRRWYPIDVFESLWTQLDALIDSGDIVACEEVREELKRKDDELLARLKGKPALFVPFDDVQQEQVIEIIGRFPRWVKPDSNKNNADPFVVALGAARGLTVVTYETNGGPSQVTVPYACRQIGVPCWNFVEFLRAARIRFH